MAVNPESLRYQRQRALPEIGLEGQKRLSEAHVAVVGAGALGSSTLLYLAAAGVGHLRIIDPDRLDETNLQRQVIHRTADLGRLKALSAADAVAALNPEVEVEAVAEALTPDNCRELLKGCDVVADCVDNLQVKYLLSDCSRSLGVTVVYGGIRRFGGVVMTITPESADLRTLYGDPSTETSAPPIGPFGAVPGIIGSYQAVETIKAITGIGTLLTDRLLTIDTLRGTQTILPLK